MRRFEIWMEGYEVTGNSAPHSFVGYAEAETFEEACYIALKDYEKRLGKPGLIDEYYDPQRNTYWGMRMFDNESDAAKLFG